MSSPNCLSALESRWQEPREELANAASILLIEAAQALPMLSPRPRVQTVVLTHRRLLSAAMLHRVRPEIVVAPLIAPDWDLVDLGADLERLGYRGTVHVLTRPLPREELILGELAALYGGLSFRILDIA